MTRTVGGSLALRGAPVPAVIAHAGRKASIRFLEFFAAQIRNRNTREAYMRAVGQFLQWCEQRGIGLTSIEPLLVAAYVERLLASGLSRPSVKQHLAAIRRLLDWMVTGGFLPFNPASAVRGPKHVVKKGKTPVLLAEEARALLNSIDISTVGGLRDRALIGVMVYSFARVSAVVGMNGEDYFQQGKRSWLRLQEKGGKQHEVPAHHNAVEYLDAYLAAAPCDDDQPLFRSLTKERSLGRERMTRVDAWRMIQRRMETAKLNARAGCHTMRATGITAYLSNGGTIEKAQAIACHESPRTTKLYDRTSDEISLDEVERILI